MILRPTETKGQFYFIFGGHLDYSELVVDHEKLERAMRDFIKRDDVKIGKVKYAVEYRSVASIRVIDIGANGSVGRKHV